MTTKSTDDPLWAAMKASYDGWERAATPLLDAWLRSPLFLGPTGTLLSTLTRARAVQRKAMDFGWGALGLATRRDQLRLLHGIDALQGRLAELEARLAAVELAAVEEGRR